jgi:hypothetical protein
MPNTIRIKRRPSSGSAGAPSPASSLYNGELAFNENDNTLYYAYGSGVGGVAQSVPAIAGSGAYSLRGGTNATGVWPIGITGNAATVTNGVYTTGDQTVNGLKTFGNSATFNSGISLTAINTSSNNVGFFAVFDNNPASSTQILKSVSKSDVLDDIGGASSGISMTAGSGLVGGGNLTQSRTFDIGQGDGITVSADSIAVDSTVVRTTRDQTIGGEKTFNDSIYASDILGAGGSLNISLFGTNSGIMHFGYSYGTDNQIVRFQNIDDSSVTLQMSDSVAIKAPNGAGSGIYFPVFVSNPNSSAETISSRTASQLKGDIGLSNVTNDAQVKKLASTSGGFVPTWNGTTGDALNIGYSVETTLTGGTGALPRADAVKTYVDNMIVSGIATNDAMIFKGAIDCSTNPNYPAADRGWVYKISVAGRIGGASGPVVEVNDTIICGTDGTAAGTHAAVGSNWNILQTNIVDASILVTGPTSATSGNFAMFDGTTGKIIKDSSLNSSSFATASHTHGNITNAGAIGSTANLPIITTTAGALTTGSFGSTVNTFCQGNDSRLSDTRNTTNSITVNNGGAGDISSFTFNGSAARTISYNSIGAPSISGTNATGTWNISVTGNAGTVTSGIYTYGSYADPSWISSLAKSKVGLSNVENTALSTWAGSTNLTTLGTVVSGTWNATTIGVDKGGTGQTSYTNGQLLIGNSTGNTLTKATLTQGTGIAITNGTGSISIAHASTSSLNGAQGSNGIASITVDGLGHVTAVTSATYLTAGTVCAAIVDCSLDGGTF